jgi:hypothetical protein
VAGLIASTQKKPKDEVPEEIPEHLLQLPGLCGEIMQYVLDSAIMPQPLLAMATSLLLVGTAAGRFYISPSASGTNLYIICVAKTGSGKDHALKSVGKIMQASSLQSLVGPSEFMSSSGAYNYIAERPLSLCVMDEFGSIIKRINSKYARSFESEISKFFRMVWTSPSRSCASPPSIMRVPKPLRPAASPVGRRFPAIETASGYPAGWSHPSNVDLSSGAIQERAVLRCVARHFVEHHGER